MTIAILDRVGFEVDAVDVFCGFGGSSQGIHAAGATVRAAANHSELALECHAKNFPDVEHWQADLVDKNDPQVLDRDGKKVAGSYLDPADLPAARYAWVSPACTHHSQANATKIYQKGLQQALWDDDEYDDQAFVNSERSRVTMSCVLRYVAARRPEIVVVENVVEVTTWGPARDGSSAPSPAGVPGWPPRARRRRSGRARRRCWRSRRRAAWCRGRCPRRSRRRRSRCRAPAVQRSRRIVTASTR